MSRTQRLGACQACLRDFVLHGEEIVLHGYTRPGVGYIIGHCPGTRVAPFELSCEFTKTWRETLITQTLPEMQALLASYVADTATRYTASHYDHKLYKYVNTVVIKGSTTNPAPWDKKEPDWDALRRSAICNTENEIRYLNMEIEWLGKRIASWVYSPEKLRVGYPREPLSREGQAAAAERKAKREELAQRKADKAARAAARLGKAENDVAQIVGEMKEALGRSEVQEALRGSSSHWFGDFNMGVLADKWSHLTEILSRCGLLAVKPGMVWDLKAVMAAQRFDWMRKPEAIRSDLRSVQASLKKELAAMGIKTKKKVAA